MGSAEENDEEFDEAAEASYSRHTLAAVISPGALALAAFTLAVSGLFAGLGPLSQVLYFGTTQSPLDAAKKLALGGIGTAVIALALALWSLFRPEVGPPWPRPVAGGASLVALLVIAEYVFVLVNAAHTKIPPPGG